MVGIAAMTYQSPINFDKSTCGTVAIDGNLLVAQADNTLASIDIINTLLKFIINIFNITFS
jgi:hypothetical protein